MSTMTQPMSLFRSQATSLLRDYAELMKARVTTLIVMTAWCGYYFGAQKVGSVVALVGTFSRVVWDRPGLQRHGRAE